jgi:hypothetical protein
MSTEILKNRVNTSRYQFRLRDLLLLVTIVGSVLGVVATKVQNYRYQCIAADEISKHGAIVGWSWAGNVTFIELVGANIADDELGTLKNMPHVEALFLGNTTITDDAVKHLKKMRNLKMLSVSGTKMSPAGVAALRRELPDTKILDIGVGGPPAQSGERMVRGGE